MQYKNTPLFFLFIVFFFLNNAISQELQYSIITIPPELKENANAVIRNYSIDVSIESVDKMIVKKRRVVTVLNKLGNVDIGAYVGYDKDTKVLKISAIIYNAFGKKIKKYTKSKFKDVSAVDGNTFYSDSRAMYLDYTPTSYPFTVVFETEYKTSSTAFIPRWAPLEGYLVGVQKSSFRLLDKPKIKLRVKENNFKGYPIKNTSTEFKLHYSIENQKATKPEKLAISYLEFQPKLQVALEEFTVKGLKGKAKDWKDLGKWEYDFLYKDEDNISKKTITTIKNLVAGIDDPVKKAKIVYEYVQNKTRYINVSIGIGGLKPVKSKEVDELGYGDCKGLTNYTRALLKVVGVQSYFTELYAGNEKRDMDFNFPSIHGNHVILNIPNNGNDIWLECTNQTMPFGFLGNFTDDREVLVITPKGAVKKRTPKYINEDNLQITKANIQLDEKGNVKATVKITSKGIQYDNIYYVEKKTKEDLESYYKKSVWGYNNNLEILSTEIQNDKDNVVFTQKVEVAINEYASINQENYLVRVNVFNKNTYVPKRYRNRKLPFKIDRGYKDIDVFDFVLPVGYKIEKFPIITSLETKFGTYKITFTKTNENHFRYQKELLIKAGIYTKEDYKSYRKFRRKIAKLENLRILLIKK